MNNRAKLELCEAALRRAQMFISGCLDQGLVDRPHLGSSWSPLERIAARELVTEVERCLGWLQPKTNQHDAGAIARCSYCGRDCGLFDGWSGSFPRPTNDSTWSIGSGWVAR